MALEILRELPLPRSTIEEEVPASVPAPPDGVFKSFSVGQLWKAAVLAQGGMAVALRGVNHEFPESVTHPIILGMATLSLATGCAIEIYALKKKGYSANVVTTFFYKKTGHPELSSVFAACWSNVQGLITNPADTVSIISLLTDSQGELFWANLESRAIVGLIYTATANWLIRTGKVDAFMHGVEWALEVSRINALDRWLVPAQEVYYPDNPKPRSSQFPSDIEVYAFRR